MQTTNDIFVNPSAIKTKIAGKLVDDTEEILGKTKLLDVKRERNFNRSVVEWMERLLLKR